MSTDIDISMSLDGFISAAGRTPDEPMGVGGEQLHDWAMGDDAQGREILAAGVGSSGAVICGRRTYDDSIRWWGPDGPTGPARLPVFVVSHDAPATSPDDSVYHVVSAGIEAALERATTAANGKSVSVMGGAATAQQYLSAGLIDEVSIHLVPVLLGSGLRMFSDVGGDQVRIEPIDVVDTAAATHLRYQVLR